MLTLTFSVALASMDEAVWIERYKAANARERQVPCPNPQL